MADKLPTWTTDFSWHNATPGEQQQHKPTEEQLYTFEEHQRIINAAIDKQVAETAATLMVNNPFGFPTQPKPTRWQRTKRNCIAYCTRIRDAWLVLCGRADIDSY